MRCTMKSEEIAKLAGVSRSTVSRVLNNYDNVPEKTREKVMEVINKYNFELNMSARVLAGKRTDTIGLFLFSVYDQKNPHRIYGNSYFGPFVEAVVDTGNYKGYYVLVHTIYNPDDCRRIQQTFLQKRIDAGIIIGTERSDAIKSVISKVSNPLVIVDYDPAEIKRIMAPDGRITVINSDDRKGIDECVDELVSLGHREIGLIEGRTTTYSGFLRSDEFKKRMSFHGLPVKKEYCIKGDFVRSKTENAITKMIKLGRLPTALIASNDDMAIAAAETFRRHGIRAPEDISVIGYDDSLAASLVQPSLTTVRIPFYKIAQKAVESVTDMVDEKSTCYIEYVVDVELIRRKSCARPAEKGETI